jgi:PhnB protein
MRLNTHLAFDGDCEAASDDGSAPVRMDCTEDYPCEPIKCAYVVINLNDADRAERVFNALADGGIVEMPLQQTFWAHRCGIAVDRFGVPWMVSCEMPA